MSLQLSPNSTTDAVLIGRIRKGDAQAFETLVERYQEAVFSTIVRQLRNEADARELTQEVFVRAYRALGDYRGEAKFSTWITRIALNRINSWFSSPRGRRAQVEVSFDPESHDRAAEQPDTIEREAALERMHRAMVLLLPIHREVLGLCGLEGKSYEEAAELLEIPIGTVRSRLNAARLKIRRIMTEELV